MSDRKLLVGTIEQSRSGEWHLSMIGGQPPEFYAGIAATVLQYAFDEGATLSMVEDRLRRYGITEGERVPAPVIIKGNLD